MSISRAVNYKLTEDFEINKFLLKIYKDRDARTCDLNIIVKNNVKFRAHKLILGFTSDFFHKLLQNEQIQTILIPDYSCDSVQCLLELIYTGEAQIPVFLREEFVSLCRQFVVKIPGIHKLESAKIGNEEEPEKSISAVENFMETSMNTEMKSEEPLSIDDSPEMDEPAQPTNLIPSMLLDTENGNISFEDIITKAAMEVLYNGKTIVDAGKLYGIPKTTLHRRVKKMKTGDLHIKRKYYPKHVTRKPLSSDQISSPHANPKIDYHQRLKNACVDVIEQKMTYQNASVKHGVPRSVVFRKVKLIKQGGNLDDIGKPKMHYFSPPGEIGEESHEVEPDIHPDLNMDEDSINNDESENNSRLSGDSNEPLDFSDLSDSLHSACVAVQEGMTLLAASQKFGIPSDKLHQYINRFSDDFTENSPFLEPETELNEGDDSFLPMMQVKHELSMNGGDFEEEECGSSSRTKIDFSS